MAPLTSTPDEDSGRRAESHALPPWWSTAADPEAEPGADKVFVGDLGTGWIVLATPFPGDRIYVEPISKENLSAVGRRVGELVWSHGGQALLVSQRVTQSDLSWFHDQGHAGRIVHRDARVFPENALAAAFVTAEGLLLFSGKPLQERRSLWAGPADTDADSASHHEPGEDVLVGPGQTGRVGADAGHERPVAVAADDGHEFVDDLGKRLAFHLDCELSDGEVEGRRLVVEVLVHDRTLPAPALAADPPQQTLRRIWESKILAGGDQS